MDPSTANPELLDEAFRATRTSWIVLGIVGLVTGVVALAMPGIAALATSLVLAAVLAVGGIARLVHAFQVRRWAWFFGNLVLGILYLAAAVLIFAQPMLGALSLALVVAFWCIGVGVVQIGSALSYPRLPAWGWMLASGVAGIVLGVLILSGWPAAALWALGLLVGMELVFSGISELMVGLSIPQLRLHEPPTAPG